MMIIIGIITSSMATPLAKNIMSFTNFDKIIKDTKTLSIVTIIISVVTAPVSLLPVFLSSKVTFSKRSARSQDISSIIKTIVIYQIIIVCISLISSIVSYSSQSKSFDETIKSLETYSDYSSKYNFSSSTLKYNIPDEEQVQGYIKDFKEIINLGLINIIVGFVVNVIVAVGCVLLQKKILENNVVEV